MAAIVEVHDLTKHYGSVVAAEGISFSVERGEIFGILGPNGAGKTTTVEGIGGLRRPDAGRIRVLGLDPYADGPQLKQRLGMQLQESRLPDKINVWEALDLYASFYNAPADGSELLDQLGLADKRNARFADLSGGQKQRLSIALALIGSPEVAILDELTTGLDPHARREVWELIEGIRARGVTILLVTHFMDEAERLADRIAIIDEGRLVAVDTPAGLVSRVASEQRIRFRPSGPLDQERLSAATRRQRRVERWQPGRRGRYRQPPRRGRGGAGSPGRRPIRPAGRAGQPGRRVRRPHRPSARSRRRRSRRQRIRVRSPSMSATAKLTFVEAKLFARDVPSLFFAVAFPAILLVVIGSFFPGAQDPSPDLGGLRLVDIYAPIVIALGLASAALAVLPGVLAGYRQYGILRRMATTPVGPVRLLAAQLGVQAGAASIGAVGAIVALIAVFASPAPQNAPGFVLAFVLAVASVFGLGLLVAAVARTSGGRAGPGVAPVLPDALLLGRVLPARGNARGNADHQRPHADGRGGAGPHGHVDRPGSVTG